MLVNIYNYQKLSKYAESYQQQITAFFLLETEKYAALIVKQKITEMINVVFRVTGGMLEIGISLTVQKGIYRPTILLK